MNCTRCEDSGWLTTSIKNNTVRRCECKPPIEKTRSTIKQPKGLTSEGFPIASLEEAQQRFEKGLRESRPDFTDKKIQSLMDEYFPKLKESF